MSACLEDAGDSGVRTLGEAMQAYLTQARHEAAFPLARLTTDGCHLVLFRRCPDGSLLSHYDIPTDQLRTAAGVAFWARQIALKTWVTPRHMHRFADLIYRLNGGSD